MERWGEERSEEREPSESLEAEGRRGETLEDWEYGEEEADLSEEDEDHREETKQIAVPQELWEEAARLGLEQVVHINEITPRALDS